MALDATVFVPRITQLKKAPHESGPAGAGLFLPGNLHHAAGAGEGCRIANGSI